jgi:Tol biopolymer transport system component
LPIEPGGAGGGGGGSGDPLILSPDGSRTASPPLGHSVEPPPSVAIVTSLPPTSEPAAPDAFPVGSKIAFVATPSGNPDLFLANNDGSQPQQLSFSQDADLDPSFSGDRRELVWSSNRGGIFAIYRMWVAGSRIVRLTFGTLPATQPSFSPDGQRIAFVRWTGRATSVISVIDRDGTGEVRLSPDGGQAFGVSWSPDGSQLAFGSSHVNTSIPILYRMGSHGGPLTPLTQANGANYPVGRSSWSPDGSQIAYATNIANHGLGITLMDTQGQNLRELTHANDSDPTWSPDGSQILFTRPVGGKSQLAKLAVPSGVVSPLSISTSDGGQPTW